MKVKLNRNIDTLTNGNLIVILIRIFSNNWNKIRKIKLTGSNLLNLLLIKVLLILQNIFVSFEVG